MGRFVKNLKLHSGSYAIGMPSGTNSFGPQYPVDGQVRFNSDISKLQAWYNDRWNTMQHGGRVNIAVDSFTGDGTTTSFTMTQSSRPYAVAGDEAMLLVFIGNVFQSPTTAYTLTGNNITFTSIPNPGVPIIVLHNFNSTDAL